LASAAILPMHVGKPVARQGSASPSARSGG
jgi:hypothetical protein